MRNKLLNKRTDDELVDLVKEGNAAAFRTLYYRHVDRVFAVVSRILGPGRTDRDDVVQEIFLQTYRSIGRFKGESSFGTWLHRVAINVAYSHIRRKSRREDMGSDYRVSSVPDERFDEKRIDARRAVKLMFDMLERLAAKNRIVFVLYEFEGLTLDEISRYLDTPINTVASRLRRSRKILMQAVSEGIPLSKGVGK